ncbi:dystonin isoform X3 [Ammospiza nelsoni]|uniref:dystonin isoform X3 n=1 Tax=Ammospiza nelsoni TaxID=2857394 RepID=UPI00286AF7CC|nr:dystonin isoform X3 [Ammospiza nelsoni]
MNSSSYSYHSSDSLFSNSTSTRTSVDSNENFLSVNCGPTLIKSCISFGNGTLEGNRLEMLQQIANRIQRDSRSCEDKLILARNALQSDTKRLESGLQFQHEAEIAGYLLESENLLRQQVIDAQILIDGKYYQADQLVQRVAKLRDDLMALRTECSSVYSKGHALTTEQTKLMISGITESLNSGFTTNLTPELNAAMTQGLTPTLTSGLSSGLSSRLTPAVTPAYPSGIPPRLIQSYATGVDGGALQTLKLMQIRKPLMKSAFVDQNLTEEEVNMKFVQDLLSWVEEMQVQLDRVEWGSDLPSVESHLENHKNVHKAIEEFESSLKEAKISEIQMTAPLKLSYAEKLHKLESQYSKLLNTSRNQERHLDTLHNFVSRATRELIWLNEKEEEEVAYDWSERSPNITRKKEYHAELMRELDEKEDVIKSVQEIAEQLLLENHPARLTIEAYRAAMQTQWSWILQLCHCVEQHLRENAAYFEFFSDAKEAMEYLKNLKDTIYRKYSCDRSSSLHRLEDLVQESMEEKEQLLQYKSTVAGLVGRAKAIIQLKPRNPDCVLKTSIPIKAICDYRQIEITIYKDDECVLANNSHRAKWKVISPSGNEAMVPSVCFTVPPPNKEAIDTANRIEQQFQNVLALWHESHVNMKSVVSWHYLTNEIEVVRAGNVASIKTMLPGEHQQVLSNLQSRFDDFVEDSQESKIFTSSDTAQLEREVNVCKQYYQELLKSAEREEQEESIYNLYISEVRNIRLRLESCEERLIRQIRTPMERDDVHENVLRISEQEKLKKELDRLKDDLGVITDKCEEFFSQAAGSPSVPTLRSELNVVIQNMNQVYSMSSIFIEKLKTINLVLTNTQTAESLVKHYETKLCEEEAVTADKNNIENLMGTLKQWRSEVDEKRQTFHALEDELQKAKMISDQMFKMHKERDLDFDWHKEKVDQLAERWQNVHSQIENRLRDLEGINKSLKYYKDTYNSLDTWIQQVEDTQRKIQEIHPENSKALAKQLNQHKMLVSEIEMKQSKIDECQKYSEQYSAAVKDYELQTMTYRAMVDSQQKSPVKRRRIQSSSDFIIQEFMDLRTRYTALVTLMTQYMKFAGDSLKRLEEEESLPGENQLQQPVKSAEGFQPLGCNEDLELREEKKPNESMMDVGYLQNQTASSKPEYPENKVEMNRRKLNVDRYDKLKTDRTFKQLLNVSGQESSISGNRDSKLHTEQDSLMGFGNQTKEEKNGRKDCFISTEICVSVNNDPGEMLKEQIANEERQKTEGKSKKLPKVEMIHKTKGKKNSRRAGSDVSTKEECEMQSEADFDLTTKKAEVTPKTAEQALGISPYKQQHFSQRTHFQCQHKKQCFTESKSHNTLNSEDREFQVYDEKGGSRSRATDVTSLEKVASSFRELAVHDGSENAKLNLQSMSNPGVYCSVERNIHKLEEASLNKDYVLVENEILEKSNLNSNKAKNKEQEILALSSGNISESDCAAKVSESYPLDFQVSPLQNDQHLGTELLGSAGDLNENLGLSGIFSGGEDYFPLLEHELTKKLLSHYEKVSVKKMPQGNTYGLDSINRSGRKQSGEDRLEQGQKCKDLWTVSEADSRDEGNSTKIPAKTTELQKIFSEKVGIKASFEKQEKEKKKEKHNEEKRSTTVVKKSMEEEKKEHVEKAGDLLKWVSNLSKTLSKEEGEKAEKTDLPKQQISLHEMSTKKEQIAEALQTTQSFLAKHSDKMTDEERHEMEKQVRSLQESYSLLSNEALKQLQEAHLGDEKMEEKVNKVIAGVIDQTTGEVLSVFQSVLRGFLDYDTGIRLLENQLILSGIITPELGVCYGLEEAKAHALIDEQILLQLQELSNAKKLMSQSSLANIPVVSALEQGLISEHLAVKILENQLSSGYLILPSTGEKLSLQNAFQRNLISPTLYSKLLERQDTCKDLIDPNCAEKISLEQMVHRSIVHEATGLRLLPVKPQEKGRIVLKCGRKVTILRAAHEGLIDRETMFRLLGAHLMSGGIIDPDSGKRMTVEEAMRQGMIDQDTACGILSRQVQTGGILCQNSGQRLTVDEAVQCNLISATSALLVLEAQRGFVGLIWPHTGEIFPVSTSLHQDMVTNELAFKILNDRKKIAALYIPETCEIISLDKAAESGIIDSNTVSILTNVTLPDKMPNVEEIKSLCKNAAKWLSTYEFLPSIFHGSEGEHEVSGTEDPVCHNVDEAKKVFMSYLMVNSYMDANTGQRLLLYDGQLEEIINMLMEGDSAGYNAGVSEIEFSNKYVSSKGIHLKSANSVQGDLSGAENSGNNRKCNQCDDSGNYISSQEYPHVCRPDVCNILGTEQSEYTQEMQLTTPAELRNVVSSTQNSIMRNDLRGFLEVSEWTELCKHNNQQTNSGNIEGYLPDDSNTRFLSQTAKEEICVGDILDNENMNDKTLQNSLSMNDLSDKETWRELERCTDYGPPTFQADSSRMVLDNSKKDNFQSNLDLSITADTEYRLPEELVSQCCVTPKFEDNRYGAQLLQEYAGPSLQDCLYIHGRPSLEDCADFQNKLCLEDSVDMHHRLSWGGDAVTHDGPPLGHSNSTAQRLTEEESDLIFHRLLPCDSSSDSSTEEGDGIPQLESSCLQQGCGEVASEEDGDDAYETPQGDDDDSDVYDTPQIDDDDDDSSDTSQGDEGFDTLQVGDDDTPEPELAGRSVPLGFLEERGGRITMKEETSSFQELAANAGENVHVNVKGQPESITVASANAKTMEKILEGRGRTGSFGAKELDLPVTVESEGTKEGGMTYLQKMYEADVQDRNEEVEMKAEGDLCEEESEGTQEGEDYEEDYDSYDDSDTNSDSEDEMDIFDSHNQCVSAGDQLLMSVEDVERTNENNQNIDDYCYSLGHTTGYSLQFQSNHENGKLSPVICESMSNISEERCVGLPCTSEKARQLETEDEYGTCVKSEHMPKDSAEPIQSENTFGTKWMSTKSEENNETQFRVPGSQLLDGTVKSDISVTACLQQADDDQSTRTNFLLSECITDSMNKDNNTMPMLDSNHGQRQREALLAEEKVLNYMEQLKESSSQMDNKFLTDTPYVSDKSSLRDPTHPVTSWKHGQIERGFEILTENENRVNIMEECEVMELSNSPIQMENLGEIFDATVIKAARETPAAGKEKVNVDQSFLDIQGARSDEFNRSGNISPLKQHTACIKEGGHFSELSEIEFCFENMERGEKSIRNEKDFLLNMEEMRSSECNTYSFPTSNTATPKEISITKGTGRLNCQNTDNNVLKDIPENKSSSDSEITSTKPDSLGTIEDTKELRDGCEAQPTGSHIHTSGVSSAILSSMGTKLNYGAQNKHEMLKSTKGENIMVSDTSSLGNGFKKQMSMESLQKEMGPCEDFQVKEGILQSADVSDTPMEDLQSILQKKLKMGQVYFKQECEPLSYSDTRTLMQNLLKMVRSTQLESEMSSGSNLKQISNAVRTALMVTTLCAEPKDSDAPSLLWPDCRSPDLLHDILKHESCKQKTADSDERKNETDMKAPVPKLATNELLEIFQISLGDESTSKLEELINGLLRSSQVAGTATEHEGKGKGDGLYSLSSTEQSELGSEIDEEKTLADHKTTAWKSGQEHGKTESLSKGFTEPALKTEEAVMGDTPTSMFDGLQQCLKLTEKMQEHLAVLQDMKNHLDKQQTISNSLEILKAELEQLESFDSGLATFAVILKKDMKLAEEFLKSCKRDIPEEKLKELKISYDSLQETFLEVCDRSSKRAKQIVCAVDLEMSKLAGLHQQLFNQLQRFSDWITEKNKIMNDFTVNTNDIEEMKKSLQILKNSAAELSCKKMQLESTAFDVQFFISEHAEDLSPNQSKQLLRLLNTTQKSFQEAQEAVTSQVESLEAQLQAVQELGDQKDVAERQQECKEKLQEICDLLTQTENRLIGQRQSLGIGDSKAELEQYQTKQEEIQKDMRTSAQTLAEIVKNTEAFLKENGEKLSQEDKTVLEQKLNEAKTKCLLLSQKAEESKKELDKAMTTAIKQETEKVAAIEQLEESKNTIENLLDWLSNVDKEAEHGQKFKQVIEQNGTHFEEGDVKVLEGEEDDVNGNLLEMQQDIETQVDGLVKSIDDNLNQQYQKVKAQHEKIISQQQAIIVATQSAQALLEKQGHYLTPEEKDKMQRNMKELKAQYETALAESERKMKLTHSLREELEKFDADYSEFETWLQQAEQELDNLEAGASDFSGIMVKLKRQKSFSEDVISHKGDLRYITISGQRVLDAARSCSKRDGVKVDKDGIDTSATYAEVQNKLDRASERFKSLYTKCSILGNNLKDLVDKYQHYEDASSGLLSGLQASEIAVNKQLSEPIAVDPKNLQRQLEETKVLQGQVSNHQIAVEKLKKAAEVLLDTRGELTPDKDEIQKTLDDIVERYDNLSKSVNERNEKLQVTLTRSLSVQDGLDEMLDWMEGVEKSLKEQDQVPLNSAAIQDIISKSIMLEQDIAGRQSSINTMNEKVKKFMEKADPSTASTLQAKMSELAGRFSEASNKHREKLMKMEELKTKVELFEGLSTKLQSFLDEKNRALSETEAPRKDVSEVSQYMQEASVELAQHKKDLEVLKQLLEELSFHALPGDKALVSEKVNALSKKFKEVEETIKEKEEDVSSCQKEMDAFELLVESLKKWIKETTERIPAAQPSLNTEELKKPLEDTLNLKDEWTLKAPELQKMNSRGTLLCSLITAVTSPAKLRAVAKSGGTILNGEGGAPGTQDFLKNKELTTVQQAMSNVNHSYEDLGVLLNEKISELESMLSKMQNIQEESASMMQWLQKMDKTASDWEAAPTDSEAVKAQVEQHKLFETELKQSANKVQELKDKVTELLEKNPNSPEAPKWRQTLEKIDSKWKELNQVTSERQQKLEESSNYLIQFQTAEAQLKHWLVEKELMVSVLGPLSIDPNMLNTQKQQVQILLKEFDTRKPQYEQLTMAGQGILERPGEHPPSHEIVKEQLAAVAQKWDSLTSQLKKRCDRIDQAIVKSTEYQSLLRSLSDKLSALDNKLSSSLAVSTQPDAVKQQLEIAKEMKEEIEQEMKNINAAQALCEELSTLVGEEYLKAELTRQLDGILKSFKDIEQKSDNHVQQLQSAYTTSHQFQQMSKDFEGWLSKKKEELNQARPVSAKLEALQSLIEEQKDFKKTMTDQISSYERIVAEGESILQKTQGDDKAELQSQIAKLKNNWDEMNKKVKEREDKLADCLEKALKYKQHVENLQPWIEKCQSNLCELKVGINPVEIEDSIVQVRAWQKDLDKHHGMVELLNNSAESLLNASQTDKEIIQEETKVLNQNVKVVTEQLHKKRECLENMAQRLKEFQDSSRETERQLKSAKEHLEAHDSLGPQSFSNKHLTMMQAQQKALQALKPHVDLAKKLAQDLVVEASDSAGVSDLLLQAESLEQEYSTVKQQVEDRCSFLETKLQGIGHFQNSIREMFSQFAEFDDELDSMAAVGRDLKVLQSQREDIKCFMKKLEDLIMNNENANKNCKIMLATEAEASPDLVGIKRDLEALNKQCNKLKDRAKAREDQVEGTICRVEEFYTKLKEFSTLLGRAEEHEESQGPVGMETEAINQQLNTFKVFQKEEIEPLQVKQQEVNWVGQGLIQSAAKSTSTENLEHDLEDVNTRWKTLNKKVAQRAAQLQEALLHCGRFQDALESLLSWLIDTEDLVANQKPPSAEFKVVKAQIQEQKLLQRLLDDRKPTVEAIKREGEKIAESAEAADRVKILKQLSFLDSRWDALLSKAETRNRQLEGISVVAQQFHEALEPLVEWLTATEKRLANAEPIGTQASKLQQQIAQHKALEDDVLAHNKSLHQAISTGQSLKTMSSREDKDMVQEKLDSAQARYIEIQEKSNSRSELLQQAYSNAQIFGEDEVELMNWLNEVHDKLNKLSVQDCNTELLEKQHSELLDLQEEILLRKQNVDLAIQNGLELLKQTTGDEVVIVQDKLEGIKARYKDITKLSSDVSKTLEQALQLAGQLHSTHEELCKWLDEVEMELLSYETQMPKGEELSQVQERQKELKKEAKNNKGLVDTLNEVGSAFLELVPWRAREGLDKMITEDNERYRLVSDTISQKVDEIDAAFLRSQQFDQAADAEFAWIAETEKKLMSLGDIRLEQDQTTAQLQVQKAFTMEILRHKDTIDELVKSGDKIMKTCTEEEKQMMKKKIESLLQKYDQVCQMNSERNLQLERAQSLVNQFWETYEELWPWLTETEMIISQLPAPALEYETLKQQQEEHRQLRELIAEHKPHIDKMNKTGPQLLELSPGEGFSIQEKYVAADTLYSKIKEDVKKRALALDEAISQCTQFHDKIDPTLESLKRIVERLRQPPSISAEVEKIKEQISENKNVSVDLEKLQPVYETLKQRGEEMIARSEGADKDMSAKAVQDKLDQMVLIWEDIQTLTEEREAKLLDVMELAEKFWCDHMALVATIKDTQDFIRELEGPGVDPSVVKQQQEAAEAAKEEIDGLQEELEAVVSLGSELRAACGEPDKPIVNKSIDELNSAWDALNKTWKERVDKLGEAMQAAVQYQDGLQALFDWVDIAGSKLASMSPVGTDLETVKQQTEELKQFKTEAYQQQIEMERLNHQAELLLKKATQESDKHTVQDPLSELRLLWDSLEDKIISRQHKLEGALLALGQFQHALDELLAWLTHTEDLLNEQKPVGGDPKAIEIELAKHHVLQNDVFAHQSTVEAVKKAGNDLIESSAVEEASNLRSKLELLNQRWQNLLEKTEQRKQQLDSALIQAQGFHGEVEDLQQWLTDTERQLLASKPVGGLPETAREQLNAHMELCAAFEAKEETYKCLMQKGQQMLARCPESAETNVEQDINNLKEKWESVQTKLSERKTKLEEALNLAMEFHNSLQDFINWLTQAEQTLTAASRPSLILDTVLFQIDEHKVFATEVNSHRDQVIELDKTGTHLKYFSQKQDVVLIKNLLISVQSRWEKVVQRLVERGRALDDARKRAKQFHEAWHKLMEWLEESEKSLDSDLEIANDPDKIKMQLAQHKEFQKSLGAKHSVYDTTNRTGRSLKEKTTLADDNLKLDDMLSELRDKWDTICGKSVERQNKLEEALLFSGQFTDALQALIDWLYKIEPQLAEDQPVHGDIDLVMNLIDNHKVFQKELGKRTSSVQALKRSARELIEGSRDDSSWVKVQMQELSTRWETVCALSVSKQTRLEQALRQAEEFHSVVHVLLEWLAEAEQALRFHGILPDDEEALRTLIEQHREFMKKLEEKKAELNKATGMGEAILAICHPDSITTIKHWITIIRARFEEVLAWAKQHQQRLAGALAGLIANQELLEALLSWLQWAETTLTEKDKEVIPQEIEEVKALIAEHQTFMEEMTRKQPDVDKVTKTYKRKALEPSPVQSHIPVLDKGRAGRKRSPTPGIYPSAAQAQIETKNPRVNLLVSKWQQVWLLALERRRKLNDALDRLEELREFANFDFDIWRKKYMRWMNHKKSRVMDFFRRIDKDQDGKITRQEFIDGILSSKFPTSRLEMSAVADIFDRDGDGYIDYYEFVAALHPNKDAYKPLTDADKIEDEVTRQVAKCKCAKRFQVEQIGDNKYRFFLGNQFGDSQQLRLVRILRSTVMVRVGGGWMALDEFLVKNDPCRVHHHGSKMLRSESNSSITTQPTIAKGRTNVELREKFILADGASQSMAAFRPRGRRSRPSSRGASPNRSTSLSSQAGQAAAPQAVATSTPKTPHHLTRNYGKPWLTNSKTSTPSKPPESSDYQGSSAEGTPIQGSKLRLPGYLSGKGFHSGEDSGILSTAATRVRAQFADTRRTPSRPGSRAGSKAGSRSSSRRGSDASDFDISEIQSVCSDMSETVPATSRPTPRAGSRPGSAKPSKIPTPQRRPLASKLDKSLKR